MGGGCSRKTNTEGGIGQFQDLKQGLARKKGGVFEGEEGSGVDTSMHTMSKKGFLK